MLLSLGVNGVQSVKVMFALSACQADTVDSGSGATADLSWVDLGLHWGVRTICRTPDPTRTSSASLEAAAQDSAVLVWQRAITHTHTPPQAAHTGWLCRGRMIT